MSIKQYLHHLNRRDTQILPKITKLQKYLTLFVIITLSIVVSKAIFAQNIIYQKQEAIKKGNNQEAWLDSAFSSNVVSMSNAFVGEIPFNKDGTLKETVFLPTGIIGSVINLTSKLYSPPASGIQYIAQIKDNFLGKSVYAQGTGFIGLQPILPLWRAFRNIVYILSAVVFVVIGLMIMLRVKISPQAVVTIQNTIPQIITTLILVTFSYAIAGLLIDSMNLFQTFAIALLFSTREGGMANGQLFSGGSTNPSFSTLSNPGMWTTFTLMFKATPIAAITVFTLTTSTIIGGIIGGAVSSGALTLPGAAFGAIGGGILLLVLLIIMIIWFIKFFFGLIKVYVSIIIKIILAPLEIAMGAFPNSKMGFSTWILDLIANLSVFPVSILFLLLSNMIIDSTSNHWFKNPNGPTLWLPSMISGSFSSTVVGAPTLLSGGLIPVAIGISTLLLLSKLPEAIPQFIFQLKPSQWGQAIGETAKDAPFRRQASGFVSEAINSKTMEVGKSHIDIEKWLQGKNRVK